MNCDEFRAAILAGDENASTVSHLESCPACRAETASLRNMRNVLEEPMLWEEPSPELGGQIETLIGSARRRTAGSGNARWSPRRMVAAAAAVLAVVTGLFALTQGPDPDWEVALPATEGAPGVVAAVRGWNEAAGTRMVLDVEGLEPAPDGYMYEFWLSDGPRHISAGTFRSGGEVELWAGVRRADFPRLWVTLEPLDEDESPSPATLLDTGYREAE